MDLREATTGELVDELVDRAHTFLSEPMINHIIEKLQDALEERKEMKVKVYDENLNGYLTEEYGDEDFLDEFDEEEFDSEVHAGNTFFANGADYEYVRRLEDTYLDFDHWAVWEVKNLDTDEMEYVVVEEDTGFIDWDPVLNEQEALDFYYSKIEDYENDEI